jgi:hypothetical protein
MDCASVSDLDSLDRDASVAIYLAQQEKLASLILARDEELRRLEAELESHRQTLSQQSDELLSRSERIEHLKLMVEKLRHVIFGAKSEKILIQLGQLELQLEDEESTHAELEAEAPGAAGQGADEPLHAGAVLRGGVVLVLAAGAVVDIDGEHGASSLRPTVQICHRILNFVFCCF